MEKKLKEQKKRVKAVLDKWMGPLGLGWWRIDILWSEEECLDEKGWKAPFRIVHRWEYRLAELTVYLPMLEGISDVDLEELVVHELAHLFLAEVEDRTERTEADMRQHVEHATHSLSKAFLWLRQAVENDGKGEEPSD